MAELSRRIEKQSFRSFSWRLIRPRIRVLDEEASLRDLQGLCQTAEAELEKARRIIEAEARIDDHEISAWVAEQTSIIGRVVEQIQIPVQRSFRIRGSLP